MRAVWLCLLLAAMSCGTRERRPGGTPRPTDAGAKDGGTSDTGTDAGATDGGGLDAAPVDAGTDAGAGDTGGNDSGTPDTGSPDGGPPDMGTVDAGGGDAGTPDTGINIDLCYQTCSTPADCSGGSALTDADNYACNAGICEYTGCTGTPECQSVFGAGYVCVQHSNATYPSCVQACTMPADCVAPSPLFDANNYACELGGCRWLGCQNAAECRMAFMDPTYVCETQAGLSFMNCIKPCASPADCATTAPAYDADNYACTAQRCEYLGCNSTPECQASFMTGTYECR